MTRYCGRMTVNVVGFTEIQEAIRDNCPEEFFTLIMRRFMMRDRRAHRAATMAAAAWLPARTSARWPAQTMEAMAVHGRGAWTCPCSSRSSAWIRRRSSRIARQIGTLETSILPYEDCCTVFTPRHPKTKPTLAQVDAACAPLDMEGLIARALENTELVKVRWHG